MIQLQEQSRRLQVAFGDGLWNRVSVLILQVGVGASMTERQENRVKLVGHAAFVCQNFVIACCCHSERECFELITTLIHRRYVVFVKLHCDVTPFDVISLVPCLAAFEPIFRRPAVNARFLGSAAGHDGYDVEWRGDTMKFHEHFISAMEEGVGQLKAFAIRVATGYDEILTYKGRVSYKFDPVLWSLGHRGPDAYKKDENGDPVPETVPKSDLKMARWLLERYHPKYGKRPKTDVTHKTGVLVIGVPSKTEKLEKEFGGEQQTQDVEFGVDDGSEGEK